MLNIARSMLTMTLALVALVLPIAVAIGVALAVPTIIVRALVNATCGAG